MSASNTPNRGKPYSLDRLEKERLQAKIYAEKLLRDRALGYGFPTPEDVIRYVKRQKSISE